MKSTKEKKKILYILFLLFIIGLSYMAISVYASANLLVTDTYNYESEKITEDITITALTDIHSHLFGTANKRLLSKVEKLKPDLILVVGDGMNWYDEDHQHLSQFVEQLLRIAPVYFSVGNHEVQHIQDYGDYSLLSDLQAIGAVVVDQSYVDITVKGEAFRIGGLYGNAYNNDTLSVDDYIQSDNYKFLTDYEDTDSFKLMLAHQPQSFIPDTEETKWDIDLVISGHEHGGQIRVPFIGALYSPHTHMGWFPKYADGTHVINGIPVIISRGLSTYTKGVSKTGGYKFVPPRFHNVPEISNICIS